jgi:hypothetical protein
MDANSRKQILPAAKQMNDVDGNGAERAERKADTDQAKHDGGVQPLHSFAVEMMIVVVMNRMRRRHAYHPRQFLWAVFRHFFPSLHVTPDSVFPYRGPWQGSFATIAWLLA